MGCRFVASGPDNPRNSLDLSKWQEVKGGFCFHEMKTKWSCTLTVQLPLHCGTFPCPVSPAQHQKVNKHFGKRVHLPVCAISIHFIMASCWNVPHTLNKSFWKRYYTDCVTNYPNYLWLVTTNFNLTKLYLHAQFYNAAELLNWFKLTRSKLDFASVLFIIFWG